MSLFYGRNRMKKREGPQAIFSLFNGNSERLKDIFALLYLQSYFPRHVWQANSLERLGQTDSLRMARISEKQITTKLLSQSKKAYPADFFKNVKQKNKLLDTIMI